MSADCEVSSIIPTDKIESSPQEVDERLKCPSQTGCHQLPDPSPPPTPLWVPAVWTLDGVKEWSLQESGANNRVGSGQWESSYSPGGTFCHKWSEFPQEWWRRVFLQGSDCSSLGAETSLWGAARAWEWDSSCFAVCWRTSWIKCARNFLTPKHGDISGL